MCTSGSLMGSPLSGGRRGVDGGGDVEEVAQEKGFDPVGGLSVDRGDLRWAFQHAVATFDIGLVPRVAPVHVLVM